MASTVDISQPDALGSRAYSTQSTPQYNGSGKAGTRIKRPRNAFILFRCDFVKRGVVPASVERDHRNISRIAGRTWRLMSPAQRRPWELLAEQEKVEHARLYPDYKYKPSPTRSSSAQNLAEVKQRVERTRADDDRCEKLAKLAVQLQEGENLGDVAAHLSRRGSLCTAPNSLACDLSNAVVDFDHPVHREASMAWDFGIVTEVQPAPFGLSSLSTTPRMLPNLDIDSFTDITFPHLSGYPVYDHSFSMSLPASKGGTDNDQPGHFTALASNGCIYGLPLTPLDHHWSNSIFTTSDPTSRSVEWDIPLLFRSNSSATSSVFENLDDRFEQDLLFSMPNQHSVPHEQNDT